MADPATTGAATPDGLSHLVQRLDRLERENRRLKGAGLLAVAGLAGLLLMGQARPVRTIEAEQLIIKNQFGQQVIWMGADRNGLPDIMLSDMEGWGRISLSLSPNGEGYVGLWGWSPRATDPNAPPPKRSGVWLSTGPNGGPGSIFVHGSDGSVIWQAP
jgi:hypothetical protein